MCDGNLFCGTDCRRTIDGSRRGGKGRGQWRMFGCDQGQECERERRPGGSWGRFFVLVAISEETWNPMSLSWDSYQQGWSTGTQITEVFRCRETSEFEKKGWRTDCGHRFVLERVSARGVQGVTGNTVEIGFLEQQQGSRLC